MCEVTQGALDYNTLNAGLTPDSRVPGTSITKCDGLEMW